MTIPDNLGIVNRIIRAHVYIRSRTREVGGYVNDRESVAILDNIRSEWIPARLDILIDKCEKLRRVGGALTKGLKAHFGYEETYLPPLFGEYLMRSLIIEHQRIKGELDRVNRELAETRLEGLSREGILLAELKIQQSVNQTARLIEEHVSREEVVLGMLKEALEQKATE